MPKYLRHNLQDNLHVGVGLGGMNDPMQTQALTPFDLDFEEAPSDKGKQIQTKIALCSIKLYLPNVVQPIVVTQKEKFVLGRHDPIHNFSPDVDLQSYNALKLGVSRQHACIIYRDNSFYIIDLNSKNGTEINFRKILPQHMYHIDTGDIIRLAYLTIRVG